MIASKLAAMAPDRVASLALLNTTGGGYQCIPKVGVVAQPLRFRCCKSCHFSAFLSNRFRKSSTCLNVQSQSAGGYFCGFFFVVYAQLLSAIHCPDSGLPIIGLKKSTET